jgi:tetratricopeptide (TPR) repeat protein
LINHPTPAELEEFVWKGEFGRSTEIVIHLFSGCKQCCAIAAPHIGSILGMITPPESILSCQEDAAYEVALDRAFAFALESDRKLLQERKQEALTLLATSDLEEYPEVPSHLKGTPFFEALLERSWALRHENPGEMVRLAEWALLIAEHYDFPELGTKQLIDLQCRTWVELGNAYRVGDNLIEAKDALGRAIELLVQGTRNHFLAARLLTVQSSIDAACRKFDAAIAALDVVSSIYKQSGDQHLEGRALIMRGIFTGYEGNAEEAVTLIVQGLSIVDADRDSQLYFSATQAKARFLVDCGRAKEARFTLFHLRSLDLKPGGRINELKLRWLEGQIYAAMNELERAATALQEVKQGFEEAGLGYKASLAALELGAVRLRQGKTAESVKEVVPAADLFMALGIHREAQAALLLLRESFERNQTSALLLDHVIGLLRQGEDTFEEPPGPAEE